MSFSLNFEKSGVTCVYKDLSGMEQMLDAMNLIGNHDHLKNFHFVLHDLQGVTSFEYNNDSTVMVAAQMEGCLTINNKIKFVIVSDDAHGEIASQLLSDQLKRPIHVFKSFVLAMVWAKSW